MTQSFNIPDGFSPEQLQAMHAEAIPEELAHQVECNHEHDCDCDSGSYGPHNATQEQVIAAANAALEETLEAIGHPIVHKAMIHMALDNLLEWHSRMGVALSEDDDHKAAIGWLRDAGKIQAVFNILETLQVCDDDFTAHNL